MADIVTDGGVPAGTRFRYRDMGDGTHALVVFDAAGGVGACENVLSVCADGGNYQTIGAALAAIAADPIPPGPTNRWRIDVGPGIFQENNPLVATPYTYVQGSGQNVTRIEALNANQDLFTSENFFILNDLSLANVSGTGWVMDISAAHSVIAEGCVIFQCEQGFRVNNVSAILTLREIFYLSTLGVTLACGARNNAGELMVYGGRVGNGSTVATMFDVDGANTTTGIWNFISNESTVTTMLFADNSAPVIVTGCTFAYMQDGVVAQGGANVRLVGCSIFFASQDGVRVENVGSGTQLTGQGLTVLYCTRYDMNILSATAVVSGWGIGSVDSFSYVAGASIYISIVDLKEDDEGLNIFGELHVGAPELGAESVFGGGDSYTRGMLVYTYNPAGAVWTDVSIAARGASGSTFTFPAVAQDNAIYVASSLAGGTDFLQHFGIKVSETVAAVIGAGSIVVEYWNGGAWVAINHLSTLSNSPYTQYAKNIFERTGSEQVRYEQAFLASWAKNDPVTPAIGTAYYWIRFRIATAITTAPVFQQWKLHTNRFEVNADGATEYFGAGRYPGDLVVHLALNDPVTGSAPSNASIAFTSNITLTITRNQFNDNQVHSFGEIIVIPSGIDTSIPITLEATWKPLTNNAGDVQHRLYTGRLQVGDLWDGSIVDALQTELQSVPANDINVSRQVSFDIDISDLVPGEFLVYKLERDATVGNDPPDTLSGNIAFGTVRAFAYFWRP